MVIVSLLDGHSFTLRLGQNRTYSVCSSGKNSAQCTDAQSKLHSIWEQNDFKTNLL